MTGRSLTDAQIATALRAHLPARALAGLDGQVMAEVAKVAQQRPRPSFLGGLGDADPIARRRTLLLAAALLAVLGLAAIAGVGALLQPKPVIEQLSLEQPADLDGYVTAAYEGLVTLPALSITILEVEGTKVRFTYNGAGILRLDHYFSPNDAEPGLFRLYTDGVMAEETDLNGESIWLQYLGQGNPLNEIAMATGLNATCPTPFEYIALEYLINRPTHHVQCGGSSMWMDIETGLPLRSINAQEQSGGPTIEFTVLELVVGPQPAELFVPPAGLVVMNDLEFNCAQDPACVAPPTPAPTSPPLVRPDPAPGDYPVPADLDAFIAEVLERYDEAPALEMLVAGSAGRPDVQRRFFYDGSGRLREEYIFDPNEPPTVYLRDGDRSYESYGLTEDGRSIWQDLGPAADVEVPELGGLSQACRSGWEHVGFDLIMDRPAHHIVCRYREVWIDREWLFVTRAQTNPDPLSNDTYVSEVLELQFVAQPADLFELPADALVCTGRVGDGVCIDSSGNPEPPPSASPAASPAP